MQTIAIALVGLAAVKGAMLMGTLWYIASTGRRPAWVEKLVGEGKRA
ncbi:hypothetical protein [Dongia sp.]